MAKAVKDCQGVNYRKGRENADKSLQPDSNMSGRTWWGGVGWGGWCQTWLAERTSVSPGEMGNMKERAKSKGSSCECNSGQNELEGPSE